MFEKGKQRRHALKLQSAMEYLMTYGWAILIIAVVLGALFSLGVFGNLLGNHCVTTPGWSCISATLSTSGLLTMTIGQATGSTIYLKNAACSSVANSAGYPSYNNSGAYTLTAAANTVGVSFSTGIDGPVTNGQTFTLNVPCFSSSTQSFSSTGTSYTLGQSFTGYVWLNYSLSPTGSPILAQITTSLTEKAS